MLKVYDPDSDEQPVYFLLLYDPKINVHIFWGLHDWDGCVNIIETEKPESYIVVQGYIVEQGGPMYDE
jgi:hypothetical protein